MYKVRVQIVLFNTSEVQLRAAIESVTSSIPNINGRLQIVLGSNSNRRNLNEIYKRVLNDYIDQISIKLHVSKVNIGHGAMHNYLFFQENDPCELLLIMNPDGILGPLALSSMCERIKMESVGAVEPRQLPFEHPKTFSVSTGETEWSSGACLLIQSNLFKKIAGFDERFFLHGDDVDLSWRIRNENFKLIYSPESIYFHDKTVGSNGYPELSESERFYGPLGALLIAHKYKLNRGLKYMVGELSRSNDPLHEEVLQVFRWNSTIHPTISIQGHIPKYIHPWKFSENRY
jgi:GT2 family glycosyltransferase